MSKEAIQVEPPNMREVKHPMMDNHTKEHLVVYAGEPGAGGAAHRYVVYDRAQMVEGNLKVVAEINLQHGHVKEACLNGVGNGTLLLMVWDFLKSLQGGDFSTRENSVAVTKVEETMQWQKQRELDRAERGVLGTWQK